MEDLLLWRWSTGVQTLSTLLITAMLGYSALNSRDPLLHRWACAWLFNLAAMCVTWSYWFAQPAAPLATVLMLAYLVSKTLFLTYLLAGVQAYRVGNAEGVWRRRNLWLLSIALALAALPFLPSVNFLGSWQSGLVGLFCLGGAFLCLRSSTPGLGWLALGFLLRGLLGLLEAGAYAAQGAGLQDLAGWPLSRFLAAHSSLDLVAEWTLALGAMLALSTRAQGELVQSNHALRRSEADLRELAQRDALTGLHNRHALPALLQASADSGGCLLFFDLDDFKRINDEGGHAAGDACLRGFADALRQHFREHDGIVRFAGDEFLVLTRLQDAEAIEERVSAVAAHAASACRPGGIRFSVGAAWLKPGVDPIEALRQADRAMYAHKTDKHRRTAQR